MSLSEISGGGGGGGGQTPICKISTGGWGGMSAPKISSGGQMSRLHFPDGGGGGVQMSINRFINWGTNVLGAYVLES